MSRMDGQALCRRMCRAAYRPAGLALAVTLLACVGALLFRTPLRSRYWAWQVARSASPDGRAAALTLLCNAGDAGRWGTATLLASSDPELRQYGVVVLHHVRSDWSRRRLLDRLTDPDADVRELAALGLAIHRDPAALPELRRLYCAGDSAAAGAACLALERMGTPEAEAALAELAGQWVEAASRAALIDALESVGSVRCAAALLKLLDDHRPCTVATRAERFLERFAPLAAAHGLVDGAMLQAATRPSAPRRPGTIAERAAAALAGLTGLGPSFASDMSEEERETAASVWRAWLEARLGAP